MIYVLFTNKYDSFTLKLGTKNPGGNTMAQIQADLNAFRVALNEAVKAKSANQNPNVKKITEIGKIFLDSGTRFNENEIADLLVKIAGDKADKPHIMKALRNGSAFEALMGKIK